MKKLLVILTLLVAGIATAQDTTFRPPVLDQRISISLDSVNLQTFAEAIEKQVPCRFYFDARQMDSFLVSVLIRDQSLQYVLDKVFDSTGISYVADEQNRIFLTVGFTVSLLPGKAPPPVPKKSAVSGREVFATSRISEVGHQYITPTRLAMDDNKVFEVGLKTETIGAGLATVAGYVRQYNTGEGVANASIVLEGTRTGIMTDKYGYYSFTLPKGEHTLKVSSLGMTDARRKIVLYGDGKLEIRMTPYVASLKEVTVIGSKSTNVKGNLMGVQKINIKVAKQLPSLFGETDIVRVMQMLPGVTSASEGSTGMNVRGGSVDQNLVLLDGATIFNPAHFFGFFSGFNPDIVKDAELYKSSIPVKYASRLSSVLDVISREGNQKKLSGSIGLGLLNARATLEGPLGKKTTFIAGARTTYSNWLLRALNDPAYANSSASFYDANLGITHAMNERNTLYFTGYMSGDRFRLDGDTLYRYGNINGVVKWKHNFNNRFSSLLSGGIDSYKFRMESDRGAPNDFTFENAIKQYHGKLDLTFMPNAKHRFEGGLSGLMYDLQPGNLAPAGKGLTIPKTVMPEKGLELAGYLSDQFTITPDLSLHAGVRYTWYSYRGPRDVYEYQPGVPREISSITDTIHATGNIQTWQGLEPRIALRYMLNNSTSFKLSYNRTRQNIHMMSNTTVVSPTDMWKLSDSYIRPEVGDQFSAGFYQNFRENTIEASVEGYYKRIQHAVTYKNGATLLLNNHLETDVANASGKAYGVELLVKKTAGRLTGWVSYTWSRTLLKMDDPLVDDPVNKGNYFPADYDKPHVVNFIGNYRFSHRFSISLTTAYSTGRPITYPVGRYWMNGSVRMYYSDRNAYRVPDYFRTDFSMNIEGSHKVKKLAHSSWTIGLYNVTARRNPYSVYFVSENGRVQGYKLSIIGTVVPYASYNVKF
ncbi:TonB-dependent receptor [Flavihumibacter petaseus]|uniref:Putative TonB-dependent receptor n=1 Tax=Flavihumibacter petaseus NBRC 106054 TaxID=1220578 RepID=A0A0E9MZE9_9BACT|nr:TonB-dependent receptor [Flavihumibacter petaseus]GAO42994.1 putative TonB-dependent receptor [Flavihumibacter petaseus NBRC 106054]